VTRSAFYEGTVRHRRFAVRPRAFRHGISMAYVDLAEMPPLLARRFRRGDYLGPAGVPLDRAVRDRVRDATGEAPDGAIGVLTQLRTLGHCFNPVSFYYCHRADGTLHSVIAEVTNTPWGERATYVLDGRRDDPGDPLRSAFAKRMHVSPFQPMEQTYDISVTEPGERLGISIRNLEGGREAHVASLSLRRYEPTRARLLGALVRYPPMTAATLARIYCNALRLRLRGAQVHSHPEVSVDEQAVRVSELSQPQRGARLARGSRFRDHGQAGRRRRHHPRRAASGRRGGDGRAGG
jgi:uncharacterized protein